MADDRDPGRTLAPDPRTPIELAESWASFEDHGLPPDDCVRATKRTVENWNIELRAYDEVLEAGNLVRWAYVRIRVSTGLTVEFFRRDPGLERWSPRRAFLGPIELQGAAIAAGMLNRETQTIVDQLLADARAELDRAQSRTLNPEFGKEAG